MNTFGADPGGVKDSAPAIRQALEAAQKDRGTVYFPPGHYAVQSGGTIRVAAQVTLRGEGRDVSIVVQHQNTQLLGIRADGTHVDGLTFDTQSVAGGVAVGSTANNVTLSNLRVLGGPRAFAVYFAGPKGATATTNLYNVCNQVLDTEINDQVTDDGFSWSFQKQSLIRNVSQTGSRLAIYRDQQTTVDGYHYNPGTQRNAKNGFWITPPSAQITIRNFISTGAGGVIGTSKKGYLSQDILISGEKAPQPLHIGDVKRLTLDNCSLALVFDPLSIADQVVVSPNSVISGVTYKDRSKVTNSAGISP